MSQPDTRILKSTGYSPGYTFPENILPEAVTDRFRPTRSLYRTATSEVVLATDSQCDGCSSEMGGGVRLHVLRRDIQDSSRVNLFRLEAKAASRLTHTKITRAVLLGPAGDPQCYMVEHKPQLETLRQVLDRTGWLDVDKAIRVICDIAAALQHAHEKGVVHLNLHPENVLVDSACNALLTGFGLEVGCDLEETGHLRSTQLPAEYKSPEQINGSKLDSRSDLYSAGVILFETLTDRTPFAAGTPELVRSRQASGEACSAALLRADVPESVAVIATRLLERDPAKRVQTASDLISMLDRLMAEAGWLDLESVFADDQLDLCVADSAGLQEAEEPATTNDTTIESSPIDVDDVLEEINFDAAETIGDSEDQAAVLMESGSEVAESGKPVVEQPAYVVESAGQDSIPEMPALLIRPPAWIERGRVRLQSNQSTTILGSQLIRVPKFITGVSESWHQRRARRILILMVLVAVGSIFLLPSGTEREKGPAGTSKAQNQDTQKRSTTPGTAPAATSPQAVQSQREHSNAAQSQVNANAGGTASRIDSTSKQSETSSASAKRPGRKRRSGYVKRRPPLQFNDPYGRRIRWLRRPDPGSIR